MIDPEQVRAWLRATENELAELRSHRVALEARAAELSRKVKLLQELLGERFDVAPARPMQHGPSVLVLRSLTGDSKPLRL